MQNAKPFEINIAHILTGLRIVLSVVLLFLPALSAGFLVLYTVAGLSDMVDGTVARKTGSESEWGARFDSIADVVFVVVCLIKFVPVLNIPMWAWIWGAAIAIIKIISIVVGWRREGKTFAIHSVLNKVTGFLLFCLPYWLLFFESNVGIAIVCIVASVPAVDEGIKMLSGRTRDARSGV